MITKKKICTRIFVLSVVMLVLQGCVSVFAKECTIVEFNYDASGKVTGEKLVEYGDKDGYLPTNGHGKLLCYMATGSPRALEWSDPEYSAGDKSIVPIVRASNKNMWGSVPSFDVVVSTKGFTNIKFSAQMAGSSNGPAVWKLQYSIDGVNYLDIPDSQIVIGFDVRKNMTAYYSSFNMPSELEDRDIVYIRIIVASNETVVGGNYLSMPWGGETAINNICVSGTDIESIQTTTSTPQTTTEKSETQPVTSQNSTSKKTEQTTKSNIENNTTTKATNKKVDETVTQKKTDNKNDSTTSKNSTDKSTNNDIQTHIVTETNASGETVTSIVYEKISEETTISPEEKESEEDVTKDLEIDETEKETPNNKDKVATSGEIEKTITDDGSTDNDETILVALFPLVIMAVLIVAITLKKRK